METDFRSTVTKVPVTEVADYRVFAVLLISNKTRTAHAHEASISLSTADSYSICTAARLTKQLTIKTTKV